MIFDKIACDFQRLPELGLDLLLSSQEVVDCHWTPPEVARVAAQMLVTKLGTRVLDIGSGSGEFCLIGALTTGGHFTGVEQRGHLVKVAVQRAQERGIREVQFISANITEISFRDYEAFYLFNPFQENLMPMLKIDSSVELSQALYEDYTRHVANELEEAPVGTRVVTYIGGYAAIPSCYEAQDQAFQGDLTLWVKH